MGNRQFLRHVSGNLASLPGVQAVSLGGSRAQGTHHSGSDWDFAIYYRGSFDPQSLRDIAWEGQVSGLGDWGGVFNGGAWLRIDGRSVDVHYRDLDVVERETSRSREGDFDIEPLMFHLAGIPSYLVVGELSVNQVLHGDLAPVGYPPALQETAPRIWAERAALALGYAQHHHAPQGRATQCAGLVAVAAIQYAHAVLAAQGQWTTNEKRILERAGLEPVDGLLAAMGTDPASLDLAIEQTRELGERLLAVPVA